MIRFLFLLDHKEPGAPDLCYPAASTLPSSLRSTQLCFLCPGFYFLFGLGPHSSHKYHLLHLLCLSRHSPVLRKRLSEFISFVGPWEPGMKCVRPLNYVNCCSAHSMAGTHLSAPTKEPFVAISRPLPPRFFCNLTFVRDISVHTY